MTTATLRAAQRADAPTLAHLVDLAGAGLPRALWSGMAGPEGAIWPEQMIWDIGTRRAARECGAFSYRNAVVIQDAQKVVASLISYALEDGPESVDINAHPRALRPLLRLEAQATGTWYINALATLKGHRGRGYGTRLIEAAREAARATGHTRLSLIMQDANPAERLCWRSGFRAIARRPIVSHEGWRAPGQDWLLMVADV